MSDDPLAGLRALNQETETRLQALECASRNHEQAILNLQGPAPEETKRVARGLLAHGLCEISKELEDDSASRVPTETSLLDQIQRMAKSLATMQEQLVKVAMERDDAQRKVAAWENNNKAKKECEKIPWCETK